MGCFSLISFIFRWRTGVHPLDAGVVLWVLERCCRSCFRTWRDGCCRRLPGAAGGDARTNSQQPYHINKIHYFIISYDDKDFENFLQVLIFVIKIIFLMQFFQFYF